MKNHFTLLTSKIAKPTSWRRWIIAVATVLMLNVSLSFTGQAQQNYLPPGCEAAKGGDVVYYDMYFDADVGRALSTNEIRYINIGKDFPDLQIGEIIIKGDYEKGFVPYQIKSIEREEDKAILTVDKFDPVKLMPDNVKATMNPGKEVPNFASIQDDKGEIQNYTTDKRYYEKHSTKSGNENLHFVSGKSILAAGLEVTKTGLTVFDSFTARQKSEGTYVKTAGGYEKVDASNVAYNLAIKLMINEIYVKSNTTIDYEWTKNLWGKLEHLSILKKGTSELKLDATIDFDFIGSYDLGTTQLGFVYFTFPVPASQILISATLVPYFDHGSVAGQIGGNIRAGGQTTCTSEYGIEYNKATGFSALGSPVPDVTFGLYNGDPQSANNLPTINITGEVNWKPGLRVRTQIKILSVIQVTLDPKSYLKFDFKGELGTSSLNYDYGLSWCPLQVDAKIDYFSIFKRNWAGVWSKHLYTMPDVLIYQKKFGETFSGNLPGPGDDNTDDAYLAADGTTVVENTNPLGEIGISAFVSVNDYNLDLDYQGTILMDEDEGLNLEADIVELNFTNDLRPIFTFTAVPDAKKYQLKIGDLVYETLENVFQPEENMPPQVDAEMSVTAYNDYGRAGKASAPQLMNIGLTIDGGNSFHGMLHYGNQATVYDPGAKKTYDFYFYDYESNFDPIPDELRIKIKDHSTGALVNDIIIYTGEPVRIDGLDLFIYSKYLFIGIGTGGSVFTEIMIAPYFPPSVNIESPTIGRTINDAYINLSLSYCGKDVPSTDDPSLNIDVDPLSASELRTLTYNGTAGADANYYWTNDGAAGERTLTVELTDMLGNKITDEVTVQFDPTLPNYVFRGPLGDDWKTFNTWYYNSGYGEYMRIDATNNAGEHQQQNDCWYVCPSDILGPSPWCTAEEAMIHVAEYLKNLTDGSGNYGSEMIPYGLPEGSMGIFVVDKNQYENESFTIPCINETVTYFKLYNELARQLGKDIEGNYRVWVSISASARNPADAIVPLTITLTAPEETSVFIENASAFTFSAEASSGDGVSKVEFYVDDEVVYTDYESPYSYNWTAPDIAPLIGKMFITYAKAYTPSGDIQTTVSKRIIVENGDGMSNFEGDLNTGEISWTHTKSGGSGCPDYKYKNSISHVTNCRLLGDYSLYQEIYSICDPIIATQTLTSSIIPLPVHKLRIYNKSWVATNDPPLIAKIWFEITDGVNTYTETLAELNSSNYQDYNAAHYCTKGNINQDGTIIGIMGNTWYYYDYIIPAGWDENNITITLQCKTDNTAAAYRERTECKAYWDVIVFEEEEPSEMVAHWKFDEESGTVASDASGNGNTGTLVNMDQANDWVPGKVGNALSFDGVDDHVTIGKTICDFRLGFTWAAWFKVDEFTGMQGIMGSNDCWDYALWGDFSGSLIYLNLKNGTQLIGERVTLGSWTHVAITYNESTSITKIYVNGIEKASGSNNITNENGNMVIGRLSYYSSNYSFKGAIDEVRIYNKALIESEILDIFNNSSTKDVETITDIEEPVLSDNYFNLNSYPNPFTSTVTIDYTLPETGNVSIKIYNITGKLVSTLVNEQKPAGEYSVQWNGTDSKGNRVNSGIYFYRIETGKFMQTKKLLLMK